MSYLEYRNTNNDLIVQLPSSELRNMKRLCNKANPCETGGILIGHYSPDNHSAIITKVTAAPSQSKATHNRFFRSNVGILKILDKLWINGEYYLGEWHYHPNATPQPSHIDIDSMKAIANNQNLHCPEPILIIIGGNAQSGWDEYVGVQMSQSTISLYSLQ